MSRFSSSMILGVTFFWLMTFLSTVGRADLISYYTFDSVAAQESQTAKDAFGVQDGAVLGAQSYVQGISGAPDDWAVSLNFEGGETDFVQFDERDFGPTFTIAAWILPLFEPQQSSQMMGIVTNTHGGFAGPDGFKWTVNQWDARDQSLRMETGDTVTGTNAGTTDVITYLEWQHVAVAFDKTDEVYEMFINGESVFQSGLTLDFANDKPWRVGGFLNNYTNTGDYYVPGNGGFIGLIDEVAVFDEALDSAELIEFLDNGVVLPPMGEPCDFTGDGTCNSGDIDALMNEVAAGTNNAAFDLNNDGAVNDLDRDEWLAQAGPLNGFAGAFLVGDADLDGTVAASDLNALGVSWLSDNNNWTQGNYTGGGTNAACVGSEPSTSPRDSSASSA